MLGMKTKDPKLESHSVQFFTYIYIYFYYFTSFTTFLPFIQQFTTNN